MPGDEIFDSVRLKHGDDSNQWPKLSCSEANQLDLDVSDLRLNADRSLQFQGNGKISTAGSLRLFTDAPVASEKLSILVNGNVGIGNPTPTTKLEVNGTVKATSFQGDGSTLTGVLKSLDEVVKKAGDTMTGPLTLQNAFINGSVGIGTTTPSQKLHISGGNAIVNNTFLGNVGHGPTWAGFSHSNSVSPAGYALLQSSDGMFTLINKKSGGGYLGFRVDNVDKMIINDRGHVGIGVAPGYKLDVGGRMRVRQTSNGDSTAGIWLSGYYRQEFDAAFVGMKSLKEVGFWGNTGAAGWRLFVNTDNGTLSVTGGAFKPGGGSWGSSSDKRLKDNIRPLPNALDRLLNLRGVVYEWKQPEKQGNLTGPQIGLIAQEVEEVFPDWVDVDSDGYKTLTIRGFEALTVEAFKQLKAENEWLKARCETLEAKLEALHDRLQVIR